VPQCEAWMRDAELQGEVIVDQFELLFKSSREFFFAPVIEFGPLPEWKIVAGEGQELQDVFWYIKEAIDAYFEKRAFAVTVRAGCIIGKKVARRASHSMMGVMSKDEAESLPPPPAHVAHGSVAQPDIETRVTSDGEIDVELDAFVDGRHRPGHLRG
jgi:hypothetical protein